PRKFHTNPSTSSYNNIIRLEGQIMDIMSIKFILGFSYRYQPQSTTNIQIALVATREMYFEMIDELENSFLNQGMDLAREARNTENFLRLMKECYFDTMSEEERENPQHWPRIWWFTKLQQILEDEALSLGESMIEGWKWFIDPEQYPAKFAGAKGFMQVWAAPDPATKRTFLESFALDEDSLNAWVSEMKTMKIKFQEIEDYEVTGAIGEFRARDLLFDVDHPAVRAPTSQDLGTCSLCCELLKADQTGTQLFHRPVQTSCGHIFGYSCLKDWFARDVACPDCKRDLFAITCVPSAREALASCDRGLKWVGPPIKVEGPQEPHDFISKLALIFEPADEIRRHMSFWAKGASTLEVEENRLNEMGLYLARERLEAVVQRDKAAWRRVLQKQVVVGAAAMWKFFLWKIMP
ncbi:hypothetical protein CC80DRAFT_389601, partial [Byssothecium circinans]